MIAAGVSAGAAAKGLVGVAVRGQATEDATWTDMRKGAVDGLAGAVGGVASRGVASVVSRTMTAGEGIAARAGVRVAIQADGVAARGFVGTTVEKSLTGAGKGVVAGGTTGAGASIVDPNTWQGDLAAGVAAVATATMTGEFSGAVSGFTPTSTLASTALGKLAPHLQRATNATLRTLQRTIRRTP